MEYIFGAVIGFCLVGAVLAIAIPAILFIGATMLAAMLAGFIRENWLVLSAFLAAYVITRLIEGSPLL